MDNRDLSKYFKSIIDQDRCAVVICNLAHGIIYMNPAAHTAYFFNTFLSIAFVSITPLR